MIPKDATMSNQHSFNWFENIVIPGSGMILGSFISVTESIAHFLSISSISFVLATVEASVEVKSIIQNSINTAVGVVIAFTVTKICQWIHSKITKAFNNEKK